MHVKLPSQQQVQSLGTLLLLLAAVLLLRDIRAEVRGLRAEQVKNARQALAPEIAARLEGTDAGRMRLKRLESGLHVQGAVQVESSSPLPVTIDNQPIDVAIYR